MSIGTTVNPAVGTEISMTGIIIHANMPSDIGTKMSQKRNITTEEIKP
jgi:hypothetical protein